MDKKQRMLRDEVGHVLHGRTSLDEFVRWYSRTRWTADDEVGEALSQLADGVIEVDDLYVTLAGWHRASRQELVAA